VLDSEKRPIFWVSPCYLPANWSQKERSQNSSFP